MTRAVLTAGLAGASVFAIGVEVQLCSTTTVAAINAADPHNCLNSMLFYLGGETNFLAHRRSVSNYEALTEPYQNERDLARPRGCGGRRKRINTWFC
jgi:hypothetical protein